MATDLDAGGAAALGEEEEEVQRGALPTDGRLECRFYEKEFPDVEEVVMVNVRNIADMTAEVVLLEYNNVQGMILHSELSRRRIRSIKKLIRVNRNEVCMVLRVDPVKHYIDLSKRNVTPEDVARCEDRYNKSKAVHSVLRHVAEKKGLVLEDLYKRVGWPLYRKYGHAFDAFKACLVEDSDMDAAATDIWTVCDISDEIKEALIEYIKRRLAPKPIKIRADIEVKCFTQEGIDAIKTALLAGMEGPPGDDSHHHASKIEIRLIAPPMYVMSTMTLDKAEGIKDMQAAIERIEQVITAHQGRLEVKLAPKVVSQRDDADLAEMMKKLNQEQVEVDGDAPEDG